MARFTIINSRLASWYASKAADGDSPYFGYENDGTHFADLCLELVSEGIVATPEGREVQVLGFDDPAETGAIVILMREAGDPLLPYWSMGGIISCNDWTDDAAPEADLSIIDVAAIATALTEHLVELDRWRLIAR